LLEIFGHFLLVLFGVELLETLKAFVKREVIHVRFVLEVALIVMAPDLVWNCGPNSCIRSGILLRAADQKRINPGAASGRLRESRPIEPLRPTPSTSKALDW
jgi:hypothetical protein